MRPLMEEKFKPNDSMFIRNLAAFTDALGVENAGMVFSLSQVPWLDDNNRDEFIKYLTGQSTRDRLTYGG